jgi:hypothetical protein
MSRVLRIAMPRKLKSPKPEDWLPWTQEFAVDILVHCEILWRLREAAALKAGSAPEDVPDRFELIDKVDVLSLVYDGESYAVLVRSAPELAEELSAEDIDSLLREWEAKVKRFGEALNAKCGDERRLQRAKLIADVVSRIATPGESVETRYARIADEIGYTGRRKTRSVRRILAGADTKARGGLDDLDPRLLRR